MPFNTSTEDFKAAEAWFVPEEQHMVDEAEKAAVVADANHIPCFDPRNPKKVPINDVISIHSVEY